MSKIKIIPCSGIGKVYGLMSREAALKVTNELLPENTEIVCLAHIVTGDDDAKAKIEGQTCITIDGCPKMCAAKNSALAGGIVKEEVRVVDAFKNHRGAKAGNGTVLTDEGWIIVDEIATAIEDKIKNIIEEGK